MLTPYVLNRLPVKNRLVLSPMTRKSAEQDGRATEKMARYYSSFAEGGYGLLITEGVYKDEAYSQGYANQPGLASEPQVQAWKPVTAAVHAKGGKIVAQLMHAGALSQWNEYTDETAAPSAVKPVGLKMALFGSAGEYKTPRALTTADIRLIVEGFANAASNAKRAGFDGVELHAANGYLLDQFLTGYTNLREDEYGGTIDNRIRLIQETIRAVRGAGREVGSVRESAERLTEPSKKRRKASAGGIGSRTRRLIFFLRISLSQSSSRSACR
ncbi:oxidoreductase [Paenibacillus glycinis]|uniref:NADH:flavin oxidoreductase/NADH oxidase N-terminal domain-containing protein n=1 Tax=Paenibacillus glycinis TaxID=2697035 RepID=A0ABW9XQ97_9BACL|nr:hypothetical protein [Paenibacillus glycinis]NBD24726.1 hypothetical protein [Paenibacillus glycinis]